MLTRAFLSAGVDITRYGVLVLIACAALLLMQSCAESGEELVDGYRLFSPNSGEISLVDPSGRIVVGSTSTARRRVERISVCGFLIFGEVVSSVDGTSTGFFVVDTRSGAVRESLSREECESVITEFGAQLSDLQPVSMLGLPRPGVLVGALFGFCALLVLLSAVTVWVLSKNGCSERRG